MRNLFTAVTVAALLTVAHAASAQPVRGFVFGGSTTDLNKQQYPAFGGGVLVDLGQPWLAAGAQGESFFDFPYFTGRGAVFAEGRLAKPSAVRPFLLGGYTFGEISGPMAGAGVEIRSSRARVAFRLTVEDNIYRGPFGFSGQGVSTETRHQLATHLGISF
jgi:hypothetical protein